MNEERGTVPMTAESAMLAAYATQCNISVTGEEVFLEFGQILSGKQQVQMVTRVCVSLSHAKRIKNALQRTIDEHELLFGKIPEEPIDKLTPEGRDRLALISPEKSDDSC